MISACILAGGLSSRMGREKSRLRLGGQSMLARVRAAAKGAGLTVRVLRRDAIRRCGPLGGVYTALRKTSSEAVVFLSCDMPFVTPDLLKNVIERLEPGSSAVFAKTGRGVGFPFLVRRQARDIVERQLERKDYSLQALAKALKAARLAVPADSLALFNINTPEDYRKAVQIIEGRSKNGKYVLGNTALLRKF